MTYTFGRQVPNGYYAYLNRKGTLIIRRILNATGEKRIIFSGTYAEAKDRGIINQLAFEAPRIHRNLAEYYEDWPEISRPKIETRIVEHQDPYNGDKEANQNGWEVVSISSYLYHDKWSGEPVVGHTRLLRRVPRDINTDKVIYEDEEDG